MPNKLRLITSNSINECYITSYPTAVPTLPITNVKNPSKARICRIKNIAQSVVITGYIDISTISALIICDHNLSSSATINLTLYSDTSFTTIAYSMLTPMTVGNYEYSIYKTQNNIPYWFQQITNVAAFNIEITDTLSAYIDIGRIILGNYVESIINVSIGNSIYFDDNSVQYRTESGTLFTNYKERTKILEFSLDNIVESERTNIQQALSYSGLRKEAFISIFPESNSIDSILDYSGRMILTKTPTYTEKIASIYNSSFVFKEI